MVDYRRYAFQSFYFVKMGAYASDGVRPLELCEILSRSISLRLNICSPT